MRWVVLVVLVGCGRIAFDSKTATEDGATGSDSGLGSADGGGESAVEFVQAKGSAYGMATTAALAWPATVIAGDLLLVGIDFGSTTTVTSVSDDLNNQWTLAGPVDGYTREYVAYAIANATGADTAYVDVAAGSPYLEVRLHEYRGVSATAPYDGVFGNSVDTMPATVSVTTHAAGQLVFVMTIFTMFTTPSAGAGFTLRDTFANDATEDRIVPTASTFDAITNYSSYSPWTSMAVVFNPS
ncbi:MAG: hypothetical protein ABI591_27725 [Kofleriaceae bacterium]